MSKTLKEKYKKGDSFSREASLKGFRSRSALKLLEIQKKDKILKKGIQVLDIGSSPGGWSQVCVGLGGKVVAVDIKEMETMSICYLTESLLLVWQCLLFTLENN